MSSSFVSRPGRPTSASLPESASIPQSARPAATAAIQDQNLGGVGASYTAFGPQNPFYTVEQPAGPQFLDTQACLCALRSIPNGNEPAWQCIGEQDLGVYETTEGKWFRVAGGAPGSANLNGPVNDATHAPDPNEELIFSAGTLRTMSDNEKSAMDIHQRVCTARNETTFSTAYYRQAIAGNKEPAEIADDAVPCYKVPGLPLRIQSEESWEKDGCNEGFLCQNNTVNSLPQYCPPIEGCQGTRLSGEICTFNGKNQPMGPFEPVICQPGFYCPDGGRESQKCPGGTYCQPGSVQPTPCGFTAICPEGSYREQLLLPMIVCAALNVGLIIAAIILMCIKSRKDPKNKAKREARARNGGRMLGVFSKKSVRRHGESMSMDKYPGRRSDESLRGDEDSEMLQMDATYMPGPSHDHWTGFQSALEDPNSLRPAGQEATLNPQLKAFVDSMRKATDAHNIGLSFRYKGLTFHPKGRATPVLQNITGSIEHGSLAAVMGGSGAGKSTFVNVLMGKADNTGGTVMVNNVRGRLKRYKKLIGYVPQDDIVLPELTVYENIAHSARCRLPRTWSDSDIETHVNSIIDCLEIWHVRDSLVGSVGKPVISGGQRKRVSIGMELAAAPMAIFLDEPTSGLDATAASSIMRTLKAIARLGISVIVIIHQPRAEIFDMLDNLILLANGQTIYEGPENEVIRYFQGCGFQFPAHANAGDVVTDIITGHGRNYKKSGDISKESLISNWANCRQAYEREDANTTHYELESDSGSSRDSSRTATPTVPAVPAFPSQPNIDIMVNDGDGDISDHSRRNAAASDPTSSPRASRSSFGSPRDSIQNLRRAARDNNRSRASSSASTLARLSFLAPRPLSALLAPSDANLTRIRKSRGASRIKQFALCLRRAMLQQYRTKFGFFAEIWLASLAGFLLGLAQNSMKGVLFKGIYHPPYELLSTAVDYTSAPQLGLLVTICIGLIAASPGVRVFSEELLMHRREAEAGHSRMSYFIAKVVSPIPRMIIACFNFTTLMWALTNPVIPWATTFGVNLAYFWCIYGLASMISMVARREDAPLFATMVSLIVAILCGSAPPLRQAKEWGVEPLWRMGPGVWLAEVYFGQLVGPFEYLYVVAIAGDVTGFELGHMWRNIGVLFAIGTIYRILAYGGLFWGGRLRM